MITRFHVQNYKALRDVALDLTPIHVLIGPNDAGKTSVLEAIAALCRSVDHPLTEAFAGRWEGRELVWNGGEESDGVVHFGATIDDGQLVHVLECRFGAEGREAFLHGEKITGSFIDGKRKTEFPPLGNAQNKSFVQRHHRGQLEVDDHTAELCDLAYDFIAGVRSQHWVPQLLSLPPAPHEKRKPFDLESTGFGLALCLDDILGDDRNRFNALEAQFCRVFPEVEQIKLMPEGGFKPSSHIDSTVPTLNRSPGKGLHFRLTSGVTAPASQVSDGILLVLAYLAILKSPPAPRVLLVEEPENGIHPARLKDVLSILRELIAEQDRTQVILTTHSPYVLDLFEPKEVTLLTKEDNGEVRAHRLSESETVKSQIDTFTLGEIWTAEGDESLAGGKNADQGD